MQVSKLLFQSGRSNLRESRLTQGVKGVVVYGLVKLYSKATNAGTGEYSCKILKTDIGMFHDVTRDIKCISAS